MAHIFSTDQQSIIDARNQNILVSAAAGSGKTSVLTERIVNLVTDKEHPVDIDRMLVVTFTNSAAREMKDRISKRLNELLEQDPSNSHLQKQTTLIHSALITTIDSFCLYILRNHFHKIDVDPQFRVASEGEIKLIKQDVMDKVIKAAYESGDEAFYHVVDCYSKKDKDSNLEDSIYTLFDFAMSYPWPDRWLESCKRDYSFETFDDFSQSAFLNDLLSEIPNRIEDVVGMMESVDGIKNLPDMSRALIDTYEEDIKDIKGIFEEIKGKSFEEIRAILVSFSFKKQKSIPKGEEVSEETKAIFKGIRDGYKKEFNKITDDIFGHSLEEYYEDMKAAGKVVAKLVDLTMSFEKEFNNAKREKGIIDFQDMEHMAIDILIEGVNENGEYIISDTASDYRKFFAEVMVDEYQDSNLVQEILIQSVSRENEECGKNRFMVGDVKQSIYKFRLARPQIFMDKMLSYDKNPSCPDRLITLKNNYRSRKSVIDSVNAVFEPVMTERSCGVEYDEDAKLYVGASYPEDTQDNQTEIHILDMDEKKEKTRKAEAGFIAGKISDIVGKMSVKDKDSGELRPATYKDIAVLFRSPSKWKEDICEALGKWNIPYHMEGIGDFYDTTEIKSLMSFLSVIDNPLDDIALYGAMTSYFGKFTPEECARIKAFSTGTFYYFKDKLDFFIQENVDKEGSYGELAKKADQFSQSMEHYSDLSSIVPINVLIARILDETGYRHIVSAMPDGEKRLSNVNYLIAKAADFAQTSFYGLFHFLRYVELIKKMDIQEEEGTVIDEFADVVHVLSIHKSKGLEYPIVIIGGIDDEFSDRDITKPFLTDIDGGIGADFIDPERRIKDATLKKLILKEKIRRENVGEEIRVLYVAMTRAREKLIMVGSCKNARDSFCLVPLKKNSYQDFIRTALDGPGKVFFDVCYEDAENESKLIEKDIDLSKLRAEFENAEKPEKEKSLNELKERFSFKYPYEELSRLYTKTTVSELKLAEIEKSEDEEAAHPFKENEPSEYVPEFAGEKVEVKGTDRGTAYHNLLQLLDFGAFANISSSDEEALKKELVCQKEAVLSKERMTKEAMDCIYDSKIIAFLKSNTAKKMGEASLEGKLYKEQPFVIGVPANEVEEAFPSEEIVLIQGVIDVYYLTEEGVVLLDYKTDRVNKAEELVTRYKKQLDYYAKALERLLGKPVIGKEIYSFALNETIEV